MQLEEYLMIISRRKWIILVTTLITLAVTIVGTELLTPLYQATTTLRVATAQEGSLEYVNYDTSYTDRLMNTYAKVVQSSPFASELQARLHVTTPLVTRVDITPNTELMQISVEDPDPGLAARAANTLADLLIAYVKAADTMSDQTAQQPFDQQLAAAQDAVTKARLGYSNLVATRPNDSDSIAAASRLLKVQEDTYASLLDLYERVRARSSVNHSIPSVIEPAATPLIPSQPKKPLNAALALMAGLLGGFGFAFVLDNMDATLYTTEQIEKITQHDILGRIPVVQLRRNRFVDDTSVAGEAFRHVRTGILNLDQDTSLRTLLITSAEPGEGKSTVAVNLAYALAQVRRKVLIVDCDLRMPTLHKTFSFPNDTGLTSLLKNEAFPQDVIRYEPTSGLWVLTSGGRPHNPSELLGSPEMARTISQLSEVFDLVILDAPSLLAVTDATVLAPSVDVAVLVVARGQVRSNAVKSACRLLDGGHVKRVGVVINRTEPEGEYRNYSRRRPG